MSLTELQKRQNFIAQQANEKRKNLLCRIKDVGFWKFALRYIALIIFAISFNACAQHYSCVAYGNQHQKEVYAKTVKKNLRKMR